MAKIYVYYSVPHNKFVIKYSTSLSTLEVGHTNQYGQILLQVIYLEDSKPKRSLKRMIKQLLYVRKIKSLYRKQIKELKRERRKQVKCYQTH